MDYSGLIKGIPINRINNISNKRKYLSEINRYMIKFYEKYLNKLLISEWKENILNQTKNSISNLP